MSATAKIVVLSKQSRNISEIDENGDLTAQVQSLSRLISSVSVREFVQMWPDGKMALLKANWRRMDIVRDGRY